MVGGLKPSGSIEAFAHGWHGQRNEIGDISRHSLSVYLSNSVLRSHQIAA
jgi:hypothetical protein